MKSKTILFIILAFAMVSCHKDGKKGSIYLKIKQHPFYYTEYRDWNPQIPVTGFEFSKEYLCVEGSYEYQYKLYDDVDTFIYNGIYTLEAETGRDGAFMRSAEVGNTRHYVFYCSEAGGDFNYSYLKTNPNTPFPLNDTVFKFDGFSMYITRNVRLKD